MLLDLVIAIRSISSLGESAVLSCLLDHKSCFSNQSTWNCWSQELLFKVGAEEKNRHCWRQKGLINGALTHWMLRKILKDLDDQKKIRRF